MTNKEAEQMDDAGHSLNITIYVGRSGRHYGGMPL